MIPVYNPKIPPDIANHTSAHRSRKAKSANAAQQRAHGATATKPKDRNCSSLRRKCATYAHKTLSTHKRSRPTYAHNRPHLPRSRRRLAPPTSPLHGSIPHAQATAHNRCHRPQTSRAHSPLPKTACSPSPWGPTAPRHGAWAAPEAGSPNTANKTFLQSAPPEARAATPHQAELDRTPAPARITLPRIAVAPPHGCEPGKGNVENQPHGTPPSGVNNNIRPPSNAIELPSLKSGTNRPPKLASTPLCAKLPRRNATNGRPRDRQHIPNPSRASHQHGLTMLPLRWGQFNPTWAIPGRPQPPRP